MPVPMNVSVVLGKRDEPWSALTLQDFTSKGWDELTDAEKHHIAGHFAWANELPPKTFGDLKLGHHDPKDGDVNFRGVAAALGRLNQTNGIDAGAARAHLEAHQRAFEAQAAAEGGKSVAGAFETRMSIGELRVDPQTKRLTGYAVVFNKRSEDLGWMVEQIAPEAVDRAISEGQDIRALVDHDPSKILGRTKAGTLTLKKDAYGLRVSIDPPKTTAARDIIESVNRGDVSGMSFAFEALADSWDEKQKPPLRTVSDMNMRDVSIVTFPAYPQTDVALRSLASARKVFEGNDVLPDVLRRRLKLKGVA